MSDNHNRTRKTDKFIANIQVGFQYSVAISMNFVRFDSSVTASGVWLQRTSGFKCKSYKDSLRVGTYMYYMYACTHKFKGIIRASPDYTRYRKRYVCVCMYVG